MADEEVVVARVEDDGAILLVWPYEPATYEPGFCTAWTRIGQHASACMNYVVYNTKPASVEQAQAALRQWRSEGPDRNYPTHLLTRMPPRTRVYTKHQEALRG